MRYLLVLVLGSVAWATPLIDNTMAPEPQSNSQPSAGITVTMPVSTAGAAQAWETVLHEESVDPTTIAFLAGYPDGTSLDDFSEAAYGPARIAFGNVLESVPLDSAGDLLTAGGGVYLILVLGMVGVERLRVSFNRPRF